MTTTIPTFTHDGHTATESTTDAAAIALDWLHAKDIENAAKDAVKIRKAAGVLLKALIGRDGKVTCNKGGFKTYALKVTDVTGRVNADRALAALVEAGKVTPADAAAALEASRGEGYENIALKATKV